MNLEEVREAYKEFYEIGNTKKIDLLVAVIVSNQLKGRRIWLIFEGASGAGKTALTDPLEFVKVDERSLAHKSDQITKNTLVSGMKGVEGVAAELDGKIWYIPDFSSILGKKSETKRALFSQLRNLYDGFVRKETGGRGSKEKIRVDTTLVTNVTPAFHDQILVHNILGTRFLIYKTKIQKEKDIVERALEEREEKDIANRIGKVITNFLEDLTIADYKLSEEMKDWIIRKGNQIADLRATAKVDRYTGGLTSEVYREVPTRLVKQLRQIYIGLENLKEDYPKERIKKILNRIAESCGDPKRKEVLEFMKEHQGVWRSVSEVARNLNFGKKTVKSNLQILSRMKEDIKRDKEKRRGGMAQIYSYKPLKEELEK